MNGININGLEIKHNKNGSIHEEPVNSTKLTVERFPYFENPEFEDELAHYEYIMQKYIYDSACLQINISGALRHEAQTLSPGMESSRIIKMINQIRAELWSLMRDSFTRFRNTADYRKFAGGLVSDKNDLKRKADKNNHHSPRNQQFPNAFNQ